VSFEPEQNEPNPPSQPAPLPVLPLEYEAFDADRVIARRRYRVGLLLIAIPLLCTTVINVVLSTIGRFLLGSHYVQLYYAIRFFSELVFFAGSWIVLGFDPSGRRRGTGIGSIGRVLIAAAVAMQSLYLAYRMLPRHYFIRPGTFALTQISEGYWITASAAVLVYVTICLKGIGVARYRHALALAAVARGVLGDATSIFGYFYLSQIGRRSVASWQFVGWRLSGLGSLGASLATGIILLLVVRALSRSEFALR
jgi:hypothetical protein